MNKNRKNIKSNNAYKIQNLSTKNHSKMFVSAKNTLYICKNLYPSLENNHGPTSLSLTSNIYIIYRSLELIVLCSDEIQPLFATFCTLLIQFSYI